MQASTVIILLVFTSLLASLTCHAQWDKTPAITVMAPSRDPRIPLTVEAVEFWNRQFAELGSSFRLGPVTHITDTVPIWHLEQLSAAVLKREPRPELPENVKQMPDDSLLAMSDGEFVSFAARFPLSEQIKVLIGIRSHHSYPLSLPNVARNVIAHELGHAIGLRHNDDRTTLMCGRPAPCRPDAFQSSVERFFPLTDDEKVVLQNLYPATWKPSR